MDSVTRSPPPAVHTISPPAPCDAAATSEARLRSSRATVSDSVWRAPRSDDGDDDIDAVMQALQRALTPVTVDRTRPVVAVPCYRPAVDAASADAGPDLTPLLACLLADAGVQVVMHGFCDGPRRSAACDVLRAMGLEPLASLAAAADPLSRGDPAFVPLPLLSGALARCCEASDGNASDGADGNGGLGNACNTSRLCDAMAALLNPTDAVDCLRLVGSDGAGGRHRQLLRGYLLRSGASALLMHATGVGVAAPAGHRAQIDWIRGGRARALAAGAELPPGGLPALPSADDTAATARWIQSVLAGERPVPLTIAAQVECVLDALAMPI